MSKIINSTIKATKSNSEELRERISKAAYLLAEQRGFKGDCQLHDWLEAETRIHRIHGKPVSH